MMVYVVRPAAADDIGNAYSWYEEKREGLGEEFLKEVHSALDAALQNPLAYPVIVRDTRRILIRRFPYG